MRNRTATLVFAPLAAAACATASTPVVTERHRVLDERMVASTHRGNPDLPDVPTVRAAFLRPLLSSCDALVCHYDLPRLFRIRALACRGRTADGAELALCTYERRLVADDGEVGPWQPAETEFVRRPGADGGWSVRSDRPVSE